MLGQLFICAAPGIPGCGAVGPGAGILGAFSSVGLGVFFPLAELLLLPEGLPAFAPLVVAPTAAAAAAPAFFPAERPLAPAKG